MGGGGGGGEVKPNGQLWRGGRGAEFDEVNIVKNTLIRERRQLSYI